MVGVLVVWFFGLVTGGEVVWVRGLVERVGGGSLGVKMEAWAVRHRRGVSEKVTEAVFTYVAIDEDGKPRPVPEEDAAWPPR